MLNNITKFAKCVNCGACYNTCPMDAIFVDKFDYFYTTKVDEKKCVNCGKCVTVCPLNSENKHLDIKGAYGGWHYNDEIVRSSSSGGAFTAIADWVLHKKGIVYGAAYSDDCKEILTLSTEETSLDNIKRSKYVESSVNFSFRKIKKNLEDGRYVLFCGTPCQVAGLNSYLGKDYEKLITVDFACGGLTSHKLYETRISDLEKKYRSKVASVNFRAGLYGWKQHAILVQFKNGRKYKMPSIYDPYVFAFMYARYGNRTECFECNFRNNHYADFIVADFWKYFDYSNLENNEKGISLILSNSDKAEKLMTEISSVMHLESLDINKATYNCNLKVPPKKDFFEKRKAFFQTFESDGLKEAARQAGMSTGFKAFIGKLKIVIRTKRLIKK